MLVGCPLCGVLTNEYTKHLIEVHPETDRNSPPEGLMFKNLTSKEVVQEAVTLLIIIGIVLGFAFLHMKVIDWRARSAVLNMVKDSARK